MTTIKYCKKEKKILNTLNITPCTMFKSPTNYMLHTAKFTIRSRNERFTIEDFKKNNDFVYQDVLPYLKTMHYCLHSYNVYRLQLLYI